MIGGMNTEEAFRRKLAEENRSLISNFREYLKNGSSRNVNDRNYVDGGKYEGEILND